MKGVLRPSNTKKVIYGRSLHWKRRLPTAKLEKNIDHCFIFIFNIHGRCCGFDSYSGLFQCL